MPTSPIRRRLLPVMLLWLLSAAALVPRGPLQAQETIDLELVLAVDISGSMDTEEQRVQRQGYVDALRHPDVIQAIRNGAYGKIAVTYVEWAGTEFQFVTVPWTIVEGAELAEQLAQQIAEVPLRRYRGTSISAALGFAASLFEESGYQGLRRVIDVSGDGANNMGPAVAPVRDAVVDRDIVINGLPLVIRPSAGGWDIADLDIYYADCVIGGPGAFVVPVRSISEFPDAVRRKLVQEIAGIVRSPRSPFVRVQARPATDCTIGERRRRMWDDP